MNLQQALLIENLTKLRSQRLESFDNLLPPTHSRPDKKMKLFVYTLVLTLLVAFASANASIVGDGTPLTKRGLRDEATSLDGAVSTGNEEKVC